MSTMYVDNVAPLNTTVDGVHIPGHVVGYHSFLFPTVSSNSTTYTYTNASNNFYTPKYGNSKFLIMWDIAGWVDVDNDSQGSNNGQIEYRYSLDGGTAWSSTGVGYIAGRGGNGNGGRFQTELTNNSYPSIGLNVGLRKSDNGGRTAFLRADLSGSNRALLLEIAQ